MMRRLLNGYIEKKRFIVMILVFVFIFNASFSSTVFAAKPNKVDKTSPTAPLDLKAVTVTDNAVTLNWKPSTDNVGVTYYEVYRNNIKIGTTYTTSFISNNLNAGQTYQFYIRAKDAAGNSSGNSNYLMVTTLILTAPTPTPTITVAPTATPTITPTVIPTMAPTATPTITPTAIPTVTPTPTVGPTVAPVPTLSPTAIPTPIVTVTPVPTIIPVPSSKVIGYYAAWAAYSGFTPEKIDASKLTHINYAFANIGSDYKITLGYPDVDPSNIAKLNALKLINPKLKTLIAVGGWSWSGRFSDAALTEETRTIFANSCVDFIIKYGFDGVDIDWEYPVAGGLSTNVRRPEDKYNFTLLMQMIREKLDIREAMDGKEYLLSFAGAAGSWYVNNIELIKLQQYVDYANIMTYDIHGTWDTYTDFNAPLYNNNDVSPQLKWSVDTSVNTWLKAGFPANKLILGVPFYGYLFKAVADINHGLYQTYSGSASISYANIAANYLNAPGYVRYFHEESLVPWLFNGSTFITYEDSESMRLKAQYIKSKGLGGAMIWELSQDPNRVLLNALYNAMQ